MCLSEPVKTFIMEDNQYPEWTFYLSTDFNFKK